MTRPDPYGSGRFLSERFQPVLRPSAVLRKLSAAAGATVAVAAGVVWGLSFVTSWAGGWWRWAVGPELLVLFPVWWVTVREVMWERVGSAHRRNFAPLPFVGWRKPVGVVVFVVMMASFFGTAFLTDAGAPVLRNGRYVLTSGGDEREVTKEDWVRARTRESRLFSGHLMGFGALTALYLTQSSKRLLRDGAADLTARVTSVSRDSPDSTSRPSTRRTIA